MNSTEIYTIGHSNVEASKIIQLLQENQIDVLVDIRSSPYSQYATQFNRDTFSQLLQESGFEYVFAGTYLGGRPKDISCYKDDKLDYNQVTQCSWYQKGIERLIEIADENRTAIMCSEENPEQCHRQHLISQTLLEMSVTVIHIRGNGICESAKLEEKQAEQLSLF
jgi:uncharacterized protein (DUF488 family)